MSTSLATWLKSLPQLLSTLVEGSQHATVIMGLLLLEINLMSAHFLSRVVRKSRCCNAGNEACDLDSGVSSLCLAFHRATSQNQAGTPFWSWKVGPWPNYSQNMIPLLNIPCLDFPLKTELVGIITHISINWSGVFLLSIPSNPMIFSLAGSRTRWWRHRRSLPFLSGQRSIHSQSPELFSCTGWPQRPSRWGQGPGK